MPGLYGIVSFKDKPDSDLFDSLGKKVSAFDSPIYSYHDDHVHLGFKTLNIVDFAEQPFFEQRMHLVLFFWGEVYSHPFGEQSVSHTIFDFYLHDHLNKLINLNGLYSFVLWDEGRKKLILGSDIYASRPLYYCECENQFIFSPSPLILAQVLGKNQLNPEAIQHFLCSGMILCEHTFSKDIYKLRHGRCLEYSESGIKKNRYFQVKYYPQKMSLNDASKTMVETAQEAARRMTEGNISLSLSGGSDSRLAAMSVIKAGFRPPAFTYGQSNSRDIEIAEEVCNTFKMHHHPLVITPDFLPENLQEAVYNTGGYSSAINIHGISIRHEVKKFADIVIRSLWGKNLLGYFTLKTLPFQKARHDDDFLHYFINWHQRGFTTDELREMICADLPLDSLEQSILRIIRENRQESYLDTFMAINHFEIGSQKFMTGFWLENDLLEFRDIFLDYDLMEFNLKVPADHKQIMKLGRHIWRFMYPQAGKIKLQRTNLPLSASLFHVSFNRLIERITKTEYPPEIFDYDEAFRKSLDGWLRDILCSNDSLIREYLKAEKIDNLISEHIENKADNSDKIGLLLTFEQVLRILDNS